MTTPLDNAVAAAAGFAASASDSKLAAAASANAAATSEASAANITANVSTIEATVSGYLAEVQSAAAIIARSTTTVLGTQALVVQESANITSQIANAAAIADSAQASADYVASQIDVVEAAEAATHIDAVKKLVATYFKQEDVLETFKGEYMARCKGPRGIQRKAFEEAKIVGVPIRSVKFVIDLMKIDRRKEKLRHKIEPDDAAIIAEIQKELGQLADLPLGQAALERESDAEWEAAGAKAAGLVASIAGDGNVTRLSEAAQKIQAGIRKLPDEDVDLEQFEYDGGDAA